MTRNGFSLVELLAAMVAGSLLLIGVGWAVAGITRDYQRTTDELSGPLLRATDVITTTIEQSKVDGAGQGPSRLVMLGPGPQALRSTRTIESEFSIEATPSGQRLIASYHSANGTLLPDVPENKTVLLDDLRDSQFVFGRRAGLEPTIVWIGLTGTWRGKPFRVAARPLLSGQGGCRFDPISLICRS